MKQYIELRQKLEKSMPSEDAHTLAYSDYKQRHEIHSNEDAGVVLNWMYEKLQEEGKLSDLGMYESLFKQTKGK